MSRNDGRDWRGIGLAAMLAAAIAFPIGIIVGGSEPARETGGDAVRRGPSGGPAAPGRNVYSPRVIGDPHVIEKQREVVRALEASCRQSGHHCAEAEQARLRVEEAESGR